MKLTKFKLQGLSLYHAFLDSVPKLLFVTFYYFLNDSNICTCFTLHSTKLLSTKHLAW